MLDFQYDNQAGEVLEHQASLNRNGSVKDHVMAENMLCAQSAESQAPHSKRDKWRNKAGSKTYYAWRNMRDRCLKPHSASWANYGGRGVSICDRWVNDYDAFFDDMGEAPAGLTLDRIDVSLGYSPENCRWASWAVQAANKRVTVFLEHNGKTQNLTDWAQELGLGKDTLWRRINVLKMPLEQALSPENLRAQRKCGTRYGYETGCRCADCKAAQAERFRKARARRKAACGGELATEASE